MLLRAVCKWGQTGKFVFYLLGSEVRPSVSCRISNFANCSTFFTINYVPRI